MKQSFLIDTVILIDHLNGISQATSWLASHTAEVATISVITRAEVLTGTPDEELAATRLLLGRYPCLSIGPETADLAARLRREHRWKLPDALQAALALQHGLSLVTRNTKDFHPELHSFVVIPYQFK